MIEAIVYTSNTGFTKEYALMLANRLSLPVYSLEDAKAILNNKANILYLGWLCANRVVGLAKALKLYNVIAIGAVGARLPFNKAYLEELKRVNHKGDNLFYLHGGIDYQALKGVKKWILKEASKFIARGNTKEALELKEIFKNGGSFVDEKYLEPIISFIEA